MYRVKADSFRIQLLLVQCKIPGEESGRTHTRTVPPAACRVMGNTGVPLLFSFHLLRIFSVFAFRVLKRQYLSHAHVNLITLIKFNGLHGYSSVHNNEYEIMIAMASVSHGSVRVRLQILHYNANFIVFYLTTN